MAAKKKNKRRVLKPRAFSTVCGFCKGKIEPSIRDYTELAKFTSDRARIYGRERSGVCAKHQRKLAQEIKRARFLGLLPFTGSLS